MKKLKKVLIWCAVTLVGLGLVFLSLGFIFPSVTYQSRITVNKPIETSFGVFTNAFKLSDWVVGLKGVAWISGNQNEVGSQWKFIITQDGMDFEFTQTLKEFKKNESFIFNSDCKEFTDDVVVKFIPKGASTEVIATSRLSAKNMIWRSGFVIAQYYLRGQDQKMYDKLKEVIEKE